MQPLQSVKLVYQSCSRLRAAWNSYGIVVAINNGNNDDDIYLMDTCLFDHMFKLGWLYFDAT